jgi:hypothetical protein
VLVSAVIGCYEGLPSSRGVAAPSEAFRGGGAPAGRKLNQGPAEQRSSHKSSGRNAAGAVKNGSSTRGRPVPQITRSGEEKSVFDINSEHPDYTLRKATWKKYRDLYVGGDQFMANASEYLVRRHKEPLDVYYERLQRAFYENYLGSIIDWYAGTLFRREPILTFQGPNEAGRTFYSDFVEDCDHRGTCISDFYRKVLVEAMVCGTAYVLVDFPRAKEPALNRAQEDAAGNSRAYLIDCAASDVINWSHDSEGNLEWAVVRTSELRQQAPGESGWARETIWRYFDKEEFQIYRLREGTKESGQPQLIDHGRHGLARLRQTPLFQFQANEGLWLANRSASLQLEHFNKSNALSWALTMGLFACPVIYSEREWDQIIGESYYIQLGPEDRFGWTEPEGKVYQIAADNLVRLKDEIYRVCYLMTQAGGGLSSGGVNQSSGVSKQRDFTITQEVLRAYGDAVKDSMRRVLRAIESAREDGLAIGVSGLDEFDIGDFSGELEDATKLLGLGMGSKTLRKEVLRKLALKYLCDVRQEVKDRIATELDEWCERN